MNRATTASMMAEINITPLVDVMLVLLVIFMLVTPAISSTISQKTAPGPINSKSEPHHLIVQSGDTLQLDGHSISQAELARQFSQAVKADAKYGVQILGEPDASYQSFVQAMAIAKNAGVENLAMVTD